MCICQSQFCNFSLHPTFPAGHYRVFIYLSFSLCVIFMLNILVIKQQNFTVKCHENEVSLCTSQVKRPSLISSEFVN